MAAKPVVAEAVAAKPVVAEAVASDPLASPAPGPAVPVVRVSARVQPGSTVRYRNIDTDESRQVIITGPSVPRGLTTVALTAPLADALMGAQVGDLVEMPLGTRCVTLEVLEIQGPA